MRTRADLTALPGFAGLAVDGDGNPCVWRNYYHCDCDGAPAIEWQTDWSCQCEDECPECGLPSAPYDSIWIGPSAPDQWALWEDLPEAGGGRMCRDE